MRVVTPFRTSMHWPRRHWSDQLLNYFMESIENLNLPYIPRSSIIAPVSSMSILRYRFSPLPGAGFFLPVVPERLRWQRVMHSWRCAGGYDRRPTQHRAQQGALSLQAHCRRSANEVAPMMERSTTASGNQALSRPRMAVSSLRIATRSIGTLAASAPVSGRLSSLLRAPLIVKPCSYSSSRMRRISSTS